MKKQKIFLTSFLATLTLAFVGLSVLCALAILSIAIYIPLAVVDLAVVGFLTYRLVKLLKNKKEKVNVSAPTVSIGQVEGNSMTDLYGILGIPVQYREDGTVKDIYELLGLVPEYDEKGNRIPTVYETLGIVPTFNKEAKEIPTVFVIKNKVGKIAKVNTNQVLYRKLTDKEKEELMIRETLLRKLKEAEQEGDKPKQVALKKIIEQKKKPKAKEASAKPVKYKTSKPKKAVNFNRFIKPDKIAKPHQSVYMTNELETHPGAGMVVIAKKTGEDENSFHPRKISLDGSAVFKVDKEKELGE